MTADRVARAFHTAYERLAPAYGYQTRDASAKPWEDVPEANKALMAATVRALLDDGTISAAPSPGLGQIVHYRGKQGFLAMRAAIVTATVDTLDPRGVEAGTVSALSSDEHVHLWVFTPGASGGFPEFNVPHGQGDEAGDDIPPGSWCWPPRV